MSVRLDQLEAAKPPEIVTTLRNAGIAGAGGAGFPAHAKWQHLSSVSSLLMNHQESEPNYYIDKWLGRERADDLATFFDALLAEQLDRVVVGAKEKDRDPWLTDLEAATDGTVYGPGDLPIDPAAESGVVFAYTDDKYEYGMESVLLRIVAGVAMREDLPMDHGWLVQNTETLCNIVEALDEGDAIARKYVHVDGNVPDHRFLDVPIGTPASHLLEAAGRPLADLGDDELLVDGGPGWCFEIDEEPSAFGVRKRTNCLLAVDAAVARENTLGDDRINVLSTREWTGDHETEPTTLDPDVVRVPLITNPNFGDVVATSNPIVKPGADVHEGEMIATPAPEGISNAQHASIDGSVTEVSDSHVEIRRESDEGGAVAGRRLPDHMVYWTWCVECGRYVARPDAEALDSVTHYVCPRCR